MLPSLSFALALFAAPAQDVSVPSSLADLLMGCRHRAVLSSRLDGVDFHAVERRAGRAFLLWPAEEGAAPFAYDRDQARRFLERSLAALGHDRLSLEDAGTRAWRQDEVWDFQPLRDGVPIFDARIEVHWRGGALVGLVNDVPGPIVGADAAGVAIPGQELVFYPVQRGDGHVLRLAQLRRSGPAEQERLELFSLSGGQRLYSRGSPPSWRASRGQVMERFDEFIVPAGTNFPDQIDFDSAGRVWFSQPSQNQIARFTPAFDKFTLIPTGGLSADGLDVDSEDHVWSGQYSSGELARWNPITRRVRRFSMPYSPSAPAIPTESSVRTMWVTDHQYNRISEFDRDARSWVQSLVMPTPSCWVVEGDLQASTGDVYFTCYNVDRLAVVTTAGSLGDFPVSGGGPAFCKVCGDRIYYSLWNRDRLGVYDLTTGQVSEWAYPVAGEVGGPIDLTPDGRVVVGTRNLGYIMVFDPITQSFDAYAIPTPGAGLKDGLAVAPNGVVWFTESGASKIARLTIR